MSDSVLAPQSKMKADVLALAKTLNEDFVTIEETNVTDIPVTKGKDGYFEINIRATTKNSSGTKYILRKASSHLKKNKGCDCVEKYVTGRMAEELKKGIGK